MKQVEELQRKIEGVQRKNEEIKNFGLASLEEKLVQEANVDLKRALVYWNDKFEL